MWVLILCSQQLLISYWMLRGMGEDGKAFCHELSLCCTSTYCNTIFPGNWGEPSRFFFMFSEKLHLNRHWALDGRVCCGFICEQCTGWMQFPVSSASADGHLLSPLKFLNLGKFVHRLANFITIIKEGLQSLHLVNGLTPGATVP